MPRFTPLHRQVSRTLLTASVALGAATLANHLVARRSERRHPPTGRFVEVDGMGLHYIERGAGPPVVLLHGNGVVTDDHAIIGVLDLIARDHRVIAFDRTRLQLQRAAAQHDLDPAGPGVADPPSAAPARHCPPRPGRAFPLARSSP